MEGTNRRYVEAAMSKGVKAEPALELPLGADPWSGGWSAAAVVRALEPLALERRAERIRGVVQRRLASVTVLVDELHDPHNRAAIVRSCEAFGVAQIHAVQGRGELVLSRRATAGAGRWVHVRRHLSAQAALRALEAASFTVVGAHPEGDLVPSDLQHMSRVALVLGNEHRGIAPSLLPPAARWVRVPMRGFVESLNVSVTAAILLAAVVDGRPGDLGPETRERLYARALFASVPRSAEILRCLAAPAETDA